VSTGVTIRASQIYLSAVACSTPISDLRRRKDSAVSKFETDRPKSALSSYRSPRHGDHRRASADFLPKGILETGHSISEAGSAEEAIGFLEAYRSMASTMRPYHIRRCTAGEYLLDAMDKLATTSGSARWVGHLMRDTLSPKKCGRVGNNGSRMQRRHPMNMLSVVSNCSLHDDATRYGSRWVRRNVRASCASADEIVWPTPGNTLTKTS
jgi:hypothetical protein